MFATGFPPKAAQPTNLARIRVVSTERLRRLRLRPGFGGKGRGAGGRATASLSWQAARAQAAGPGSFRLAAGRRLGVGLRLGTQASSSSWLVSWTWCFRHLLDVSWASSVTQRWFRRLVRVRVQGVGRGRADRDMIVLYLGPDGTRPPPSALTPPAAGSEPGTQACLGPYLLLIEWQMTGWDRAESLVEAYCQWDSEVTQTFGARTRWNGARIGVSRHRWVDIDETDR